MANDSATRVPEAVESREPGEATKAPEPTLPPTSDLVLPYQSRAADRERVATKDRSSNVDHDVDDHRADNERGHPADDQPQVARSEDQSESTQPADGNDGAVSSDGVTLADLRCTHRDLIAGLDHPAEESHLKLSDQDRENVASDIAAAAAVKSEGLSARPAEMATEIRVDADHSVEAPLTGKTVATDLPDPGTPGQGTSADSSLAGVNDLTPDGAEGIDYETLSEGESGSGRVATSEQGHGSEPERADARGSNPENPPDAVETVDLGDSTEIDRSR